MLDLLMFLAWFICRADSCRIFLWNWLTMTYACKQEKYVRIYIHTCMNSHTTEIDACDHARGNIIAFYSYASR